MDRVKGKKRRQSLAVNRGSSAPTCSEKEGIDRCLRGGSQKQPQDPPPTVKKKRQSLAVDRADRVLRPGG